MKTLIRIVFVIFIANGIDCLGGVCDDFCECLKEKEEEEKKEKKDDENNKENDEDKKEENNEEKNDENNEEKKENEKENEKEDEKKDEKNDEKEEEEEEIEENENLTADSLVNYSWYNVKKENLVLKIFKKKGDIFTSTENGAKISIKLDEKNKLKKTDQDKAGVPLNLENKKYALFAIKTQKGKNTVYLYCSDVESCDLIHLISGKKKGIFYMKDHGSISVIACDTENVKDMGSMFCECKSLTKLDLQNFNTSNVTNMESMFLRCSKLKNLNLNNFNTTKVTDMSNMFAGCVSLENLNLENFDTKNVTNMGHMFLGCQELTDLIIGKNFNNTKDTKVEEMFDFCHKLSDKIKKKILGEDK